MKLKELFNLLIITFVLLSAPLIKISAQNNQGYITSAAIWNPSMETMDELTSNCGAYSGDALDQCFLSVMKKSGASPQAIAFTQLLGNKGYMKGFRKLGLVDAAFVYFPLQQYDHDGCILVNGSPEIINIDDQSNLDLTAMQHDPTYIKLSKQNSQISLWPGDREGTEYPYTIKLPHKAERVVVNYRLRNGCNTCNLIGFVEFGFDFDSTGAFLGTKFLSIKGAVISADETATSNNLKNIYTDPSVPININVGDEFAIVLPSNHSMGFKWKLDKSLDPKILSMLGTDFIIPNETLPNAAGKETWSFKAVGSGSTQIVLKYVRSWDNGGKAYETETYNVNVY